MSTVNLRVAITGAILFPLYLNDAAAQTINVVIETRIRQAALSFQAGLKSRQTLTIHFDTKQISNTFETGVTSLSGTNLSSIRDKFVINNVQFSGSVAAFKATGQTASGIIIIPNIDYKLDITVDKSAKEIVLSGCHDGYPSYIVSVEGKTVYEFKQEFIGALFGACDINVPSTTINF
ncbi:hypothetical protein [Sinorhizobium sp. CCBAU 05631]|uniref:hypothetical protein n=1 Tax=Sinorhizobium sp. CCBAU 05631 TaxID=794846 RepID=UPI00055C23C2|nr:hypothetical protein [Sinorhizobium sp. CCBAU 05631]